jgi:YHS domain-containing protein
MILIWYHYNRNKEKSREKRRVNMKSVLIAAVLGIFFIAATTPQAIAGCSLSHGKAMAAGTEVADAPQDAKIINDTCPVLGNKVTSDTPYKLNYMGKTIGFCCAGCPAAFKKNPDKYAAGIKGLYKK